MAKQCVLCTKKLGLLENYGSSEKPMCFDCSQIELQEIQKLEQLEDANKNDVDSVSFEVEMPEENHCIETITRKTIKAKMYNQALSALEKTSRSFSPSGIAVEELSTFRDICIDFTAYLSIRALVFAVKEEAVVARWLPSHIQKVVIEKFSPKKLAPAMAVKFGGIALALSIVVFLKMVNSPANNANLSQDIILIPVLTIIGAIGGYVWPFMKSWEFEGKLLEVKIVLQENSTFSVYIDNETKEEFTMELCKLGINNS